MTFQLIFLKLPMIFCPIRELHSPKLHPPLLPSSLVQRAIRKPLLPITMPLIILPVPLIRLRIILRIVLPCAPSKPFLKLSIVIVVIRQYQEPLSLSVPVQSRPLVHAPTKVLLHVCHLLERSVPVHCSIKLDQWIHLTSIKTYLDNLV